MIVLKAGPLPGLVVGVSEPSLDWGEGESIDGILTANFPITNYEGPMRKFSELLNFYDIERLTGIEFRLTDNLLDHLLVEKYPARKIGAAVYIFHHVTVLEELMLG